MKIIFLSIAYIAFLLSIGFLIYTKPYVSYCQRHFNNDKIVSNQESSDKFERHNLITHAMCSSFYRDFSKNELLFLTLGTVYSIFHKASSKFVSQTEIDITNNNILFTEYSSMLFLEFKIILLCYFYVFCFILYIIVYKGLFYIIRACSKLIILILNILFYVLSIETISIISFNFSFRFLLDYIPHQYIYDLYEFISSYVFDFVVIVISSMQDEYLKV